MFLYHYYDRRVGPFRSLSDLSTEEAQSVMERIRAEKPGTQGAKRQPDYMEKRRRCEEIVRAEFAAKGGLIRRNTPHYMTLGHSPWLSTWYDNCGCVRIPCDAFDMRTVSFTYGDSMPTFSPLVNDGKEYRRKVYTYEEILKIVEKYGFPQEWNDDGKFGPERYIEAHVWSDDTISAYSEREER